MKIELKIPSYDDFIEEVSQRVASKVTLINAAIDGHNKAVKKLSKERERIIKDPNSLISFQSYFIDSKGNMFRVWFTKGEIKLYRKVHQLTDECLMQITEREYFK